MTDPDSHTTKPDPLYDQSFVDLIDWFNRWLKKPITKREQVLIGETIDYLKDHRVVRFDISQFTKPSSMLIAREEEAKNV
jgi:hypothetical protein